MILFFFFFNDTATTEIYTLSLHDALPILCTWRCSAAHPISFVGKITSPVSDHVGRSSASSAGFLRPPGLRSEEHTSELQSQSNLVCRLLLEKKKNQHCDTAHATTVLLIHP